jgi:predicted GNAT family acetyltransferase
MNVGRTSESHVPEQGDMNAEVRNNPAEYRYEVWTKVHEPYEGLGLGSWLARAALADARARGLMVVPFCPFIAGFIERHLDQYRDLVVPEMIGGDRL